MRNIYFIVLLAIIFTSGCGVDSTSTQSSSARNKAANVNIEGFAGVKWGDSYASAREKMIARVGEKNVPQPPIAIPNRSLAVHRLDIAGSKFSGNFSFGANGFHFALFGSDEKHLDTNLVTYRKIESILHEKYGEPTVRNMNCESYYRRLLSKFGICDGYCHTEYDTKDNISAEILMGGEGSLVIAYRNEKLIDAYKIEEGASIKITNRVMQQSEETKILNYRDDL